MFAPQGFGAGGGGGGHGGGRNGPLPPAWSPENERNYSFLDWTQDLLVWGIVTADMDQARQCAMIISQLGGAAKHLTRQMTWADITQGGQIGGQQQDPVTFLLSHLAQHFAPLGEESRLRYVNDLMQFDRKANGPIDAMLTRFMTVRFRANQGAGNPQHKCRGNSTPISCFEHSG